MQIARFEDGKIVERWGSSDELGILKQIGAVRKRLPPSSSAPNLHESGEWVNRKP